MDSGELAQRARRMSREEFIARHDGWYLVVTDSPEDLPIGFETAVVTFAKRKRAAPPTFEVLPLVKAEGNPYPDRISVGRARNCDVVLRAGSVSKLHAHFRVRSDGALELTDLGSQNGTRINNRVIEPNSPQVVMASDAILFGAAQTKLVDVETLFDLLQ